MVKRSLTDLMHIGELLQQARQELDSDYGLLRWQKRYQMRKMV